MRPTQDILEILKLAHSLKVKYLKFGSWEVHFEEDHKNDSAVLNHSVSVFPDPRSQLSGLPDDIRDTPLEEIVKPMSVLDEMSAEEILYYATPHYDQIQAEKKLHEESLKERVDG